MAARLCRIGALAALLIGLCMGSACADDWPTYRHDNRRSGVSGDVLRFPLEETWRYVPKHGPSPAWPDPAKYDFAHSNAEPLQPRAVYDRAFHVVAADGLAYFGSSADDRVRALDAATGEERWSFFTDGPVRVAPSVWEGKVYFGSDDGCVYCLNAQDGSVVWVRGPAGPTRRILGNGRIISVHAVRTGVLVADGVAYFCAGLFPEENVYIRAVDARTGEDVWTTVPDPDAFIRAFTSRGQTARRFALSPQGSLLASETRLYLPTGRTSPAVVDRKTGEVLGVFECQAGDGGTYALIAGDALVSQRETQLSVFQAHTRERLATFPGRQVLVTEAVSYLLSPREVVALDRAAHDGAIAGGKPFGEKVRELKEQIGVGGSGDASVRREYLWRAACGECLSMILAGGALVLGGEGFIVAYDATDGRQIWTARMEGKVYGLAVAEGRLYASTDRGEIRCFSEHASETVVGPISQSDSPKGAIGPIGKSDLPRDNPSEGYAAAARRILEISGVTRGYCLDMGCGSGRLALELARMTEGLRIVAFDSDEGCVASARRMLDDAGVYGSRVTVHRLSDESPPLTSWVANLLVCGRNVEGEAAPIPAEEVFRLLEPGNGVAVMGVPGEESVVRRPAFADAGEWTLGYADLGNTACSGDRTARGPMRLQWFGLPGPRAMADRHHRAMPPLARDGRLFVPGDGCVIAADAYNGTPLWDVEVPESRRLAAPRDVGNLALAGDCLYAATRDECWALDVRTGARVATFKAPQLPDGEERCWGYVAGSGEVLFGTARKADAAYRQMDIIGDYEIQWGDFKKMVVSDGFFCLNRTTGEVRWTYRRGVIIHPTIAIGGGRVHFVESLNEDAMNERSGRVTLERLWQGGPRLVALDVGTGEPLWDKTVDLSLCQHIVYGSVADGVLLVTGSGNREDRAWYFLYAFDAATGAPLWQADHPNNKDGIGGDHGEQIHHPVIVGDVVFAEPVAYDLRTGTRVTPAGDAGEWTLERREGCGTLSASGVALFYRDGHPCLENLSPGSVRTRLNSISRPGCWINMISSGGVLLVPEASSGCSCPYPIQASFAYVPSESPLGDE